MSESSERYEIIAAGFLDRLTSCPEDKWSGASPCEGWSARDVAVHSAEVHRNVAALGRGTAPEAEPELGSPADVIAAWKSGSEAIKAALADPAVAGKLVPSRGGEMSFEQLIGFMLCADTLIHTWDFARAAGLDESLDPKVVGEMYAMMKPNDEMLRVPNGFSAKVDPPAGADEQTQFICFTGRRV